VVLNSRNSPCCLSNFVCRHRPGHVGLQVTVDELIMMVNIALGNAAINACAAGDANNDLAITVDEILTAVRNALDGCPNLGR